MDVIQRNILRLLRCGLFGGQEPIEPMSAWKWHRLYQTAQIHGVAAVVYDGIEQNSNDFFLQLPTELRQQWQQNVRDIELQNQQTNACISDLFDLMNQRQWRPVLMKGQGMVKYYRVPQHRTPGDIDIYLPYDAQAQEAEEWTRENADDIDDSEKYTLQYTWKGVKVEHHRRMQHLTNPLLNRTLQQIIENEFRASDSAYIYINNVKTETASPTLNLLLIIIRITRYVLTEGISLKQLADLAVFLRQAGEHVDFVKLDEWIRRLRMQQIVQLEGILLMRLLEFEQDEIPFLSGQSDVKRATIERIIDEIFQLTSSHIEDWYFTQGKDVFVKSSNSSAMMWHIRHSAKYFHYYPSETLTNFFASFAHSLSHIEE